MKHFTPLWHYITYLLFHVLLTGQIYFFQNERPVPFGFLLLLTFLPAIWLSFRLQKSISHKLSVGLAFPVLGAAAIGIAWALTAPDWIYFAQPFQLHHWDTQAVGMLLLFLCTAFCGASMGWPLPQRYIGAIFLTVDTVLLLGKSWAYAPEATIGLGIITIAVLLSTFSLRHLIEIALRHSNSRSAGEADDRLLWSLFEEKKGATPAFTLQTRERALRLMTELRPEWFQAIIQRSFEPKEIVYVALDCTTDPKVWAKAENVQSTELLSEWLWQCKNDGLLLGLLNCLTKRTLLYATAGQIFDLGHFPAQHNRFIEIIVKDYLSNFFENKEKTAIQRVLRGIVAHEGETHNAARLRQIIPLDNLKNWFESLPNDEKSGTIYAAATFLTVLPYAVFLPELKRRWRKIERDLDDIDRHTSAARDKRHAMEQVGAALLEALGACGALQTDAVSKAAMLSKEIISSLSARIAICKTELEALLDERESFLEQWDAPQQAAGDPDFEQINQKIDALRATIEKLYAERSPIVDAFGPSEMLLEVFNDQQKYSGHLLQGAVSGLFHLVEAKHLPDEIRWEINEALDKGLIFSRKDNFNLYRAEVRLFAGSLPGELIYSLRRAIRYFTKNQLSDLPGLHFTISELYKKLPDAIVFFEHYPLRLMTLADRKNIGMFERDGFDTTYWTRYEPPKGKGTVHERWTEVDDLHRPNGMGMAFELFNNPFTAMPVLYHEYLHYLGLLNEAEVWWREHLFLRKIILEYAPEKANERQRFLNDIIQNLARVGDWTALNWLRLDISAPSFGEHLNSIINDLYGIRQTPEHAAVEAEKTVREMDENVRKMNRSLNWHPEVQWRMISAQPFIRELIKKITIARLTRLNTLAPASFRKMCAEEKYRDLLAEWKVFGAQLELGKLGGGMDESQGFPLRA